MLRRVKSRPGEEVFEREVGDGVLGVLANAVFGVSKRKLKELSGEVEEGRSRDWGECGEVFMAFASAGILEERREGSRSDASLLIRAGIDLRLPFLGGIVGGGLVNRTPIRQLICE